jgi:signal transduction histidine kinase
LALDGLIALMVFSFGLLTAAAQPESPPDDMLQNPDGLCLFLLAISTLPLVVRRRWPVTVFAVAWVALVAYSVIVYPGAGPITGSMFSLYAVAAHARSRRMAFYTLVVALGTALALPLVVPEKTSWSGTVGLYALLIAGWVLGDNMRVRRANVAAVEERAARLERERDAEAHRAVLQERARIARELHDVVAHSMSVMVVQAGAARRTLGRSPERATEALLQIERTGRGAMVEMRRLVGVLRDGADDYSIAPDEPAARQPQPGIGQVPTLIRRCREAGLDVDLTVDGTRRPLPSGVELVVYRVVQEALTNTMKHAGPAHADVILRYDDDSVVLVVCDDGRGAAAAAAAAATADDEGSSPGHGLTGMRERVALYGGDLNVGPRVGGGFEVRAELPLTADVGT